MTNRTMNWLKQAGVLGFLLGIAVPVAGQMPTTELIERLQLLSPQDRAAVLEAIRNKESNQVREDEARSPELVTPARPAVRVPPPGVRVSPERPAVRVPPPRPVVSEDTEPEQREATREYAPKEPSLVMPPERPDQRGRRAVDEEEPQLPAQEAAEGKDLDQELVPFGYELFAGVPSTFAPATDIPIDASYIIGPGDTVNIQFYGKEHAEYSLVVTREGYLQLPEIGPVVVAGLTFSEMQKVLEAQIEKQMIGERVNITMGPLRSIRVFILGDANWPGSYTVSALSTMTNALFVSGGITPIGSLRNIQLKRRGKLVTRLDLYDLLIRGDTSGDVRLQPGDVLFVPPVGPTVGVAGEVRRPAIYELHKEASVAQVLALAGGVLPSAYPQASQLKRISKDGETLIDVDLSTKTGARTSVRAGDVLHVYSILEKMDDIVLLSGHVERPGGYQWRRGMRVADLIPSIDDALLPRPDLEYALVRRELRPDGRVVMFSVRLGEALQNPGSVHNAELESRDELIVFGFSEEREDIVAPLIEELKQEATFETPARVVSVGGLVRHPGQYPLEKGMRISDLLRAGGGLAESAYGLGAELTRYEIVDGQYREVEHVDVDLNRILKDGKDADLLLISHDNLHIKHLPEWAATNTVEVRGEVRFPGDYPIARGEQLSHLLERAGGLNDMAFPEGAVFIREELRQREKERLEALSQQLEADLASLTLQLAQEEGGQTKSLEIVKELSEQLRSVEPTGRLVIDLPKIIESTERGRRSDYDVTLMDGDRIYIPPLTQEVTVTGEVFYPTSHLYEKRLDRDAYVNMSGGKTKKADGKHIYVVRADGSVVPESRYSPSRLFKGNPAKAIEPGDTIVVPLDVDRIRPLSLWTSVSQIIYQLAIAAASANAVGVF